MSSQVSAMSRRSVAASLGLAGLGLAVTGLARSSAAQDSTPAGGEAPAIVLDFLAAYEAGDAAAAVALFTADGLYELEGYGVALTGTDQLQFLHEQLFTNNEDIQFSNVSGFQADNHVAAEATWTATNVFDAPNSTPGPQEVTFRFALIGEVEGEQFSRLAIYYDTLREQVQTGAIEPIPMGTPPPSA